MTRARPNRSGFEQRLLRTLRELDGISGRRLAVAFSGGCDSLALAAALARIAPVLDVELRLVHVDHRLRPGSAVDAAACQALAGELGLPIAIAALEPGLKDRWTGIGLEESARRERYLALAEAAAGWGSTTLLLGHQANDQAETVLMHLFRGAGLDGLGGMRDQELRRIPWWTESAARSFEMTIVRPLLAETRDAIERYVVQTGLQPVEDESNATDDFDRNWVRHQVLPPILERWPSAVETLQRSAHAIRVDRAFLGELADAAFESAHTDERTLRTDTMVSLDRSIAYRVLRRWLRQFALDEVDLDVVARLYQLALSQDERRKVEVGGSQEVVLAGNHLMSFNQLRKKSFDEFPMSLDSGSEHWDVRISNEIAAADAVILVTEGTACSVRTIVEGDYWHGTRRSVMEDLRTAGIHPLIRTLLLSVATDDGVLLIPAIYPTIRSARYDGPGKKVGVRWSKRS